MTTTLEHWEAEVEEWEDQGPCPACERLQDFCPKCAAEVGRMMSEGLTLAGFERVEAKE